MKIKKYIKSFFKSSENFEMERGGPDRSVSDNQSSSVTLGPELTGNESQSYCNFRLQQKLENVSSTMFTLYSHPQPLNPLEHVYIHVRHVRVQAVYKLEAYVRAWNNADFRFVRFKCYTYFTINEWGFI